MLLCCHSFIRSGFSLRTNVTQAILADMLRRLPREDRKDLTTNISSLRMAGACSGSNVSIFVARLLAEMCGARPVLDMYSCEKARATILQLHDL